MSQKSIGLPMVRQSTQFYAPFIEQCIDFAKNFSADCFIYTQSIACKQFGSMPQLLREALKEEVGIPMLLIEFDAGDARRETEKLKRKYKAVSNVLKAYQNAEEKQKK